MEEQTFRTKHQLENLIPKLMENFAGFDINNIDKFLRMNDETANQRPIQWQLEKTSISPKSINYLIDYGSTTIGRIVFEFDKNGLNKITGSIKPSSDHDLWRIENAYKKLLKYFTKIYKIYGVKYNKVSRYEPVSFSYKSSDVTFSVIHNPNRSNATMALFRPDEFLYTISES